MSLKNKFPDLNTFWSELIVEELLRCGVEYFCVAPGSRSAPLAIAIAANPRAKAVVHFDERGLGFYALGLTVASKKPTVVVTTSGSACANLFPSIIEASKKKLPLIILTADRPPELRGTGANQTIDQVKIFGDYVRFFFDMPCPTLEISPETVLTTIDQAVFRAHGEIGGPVHLNCMFREPLAPAPTKRNFSSYLHSIKTWKGQRTPYTDYVIPQLEISDAAMQDAIHILQSIKNGILVVGKIGGKEDEEAILALAQKLNWPIFADITSGLRLGHTESQIIHNFEHILTAGFKGPIDGVLHLGGRLTSGLWYQTIKKLQPRHYIMVLKHPLRNDSNHIVTLRFQSEIKVFCHNLIPQISPRLATPLLKNLQRANKICEKITTGHIFNSDNLISEPAVSHLVSKFIPKNSGLFIANSMPIRDMNLFATPEGNPVRVTANRGASGIDGNIATAAGFAKELKEPCTAILGDLAFLYDLNSLIFLQNPKHPFVLIVLNNNGGAIFSFLPAADIKIGFKKFFTSPHNITFAHAAKLFEFSYQAIQTIPEFTQAYASAVQTPKTTILEVYSDLNRNIKSHQNLAKKIRNL